MGPLTDIREFNFYADYLWAPADFLNLQTWLQGEMRAIALGQAGLKQAILGGCLSTPGGGLNVAVSSGVAIDTNGRVVSFVGASVAVASPIGNPAATLVVLRPKLTDMTLIPTPDAPLVPVPLHEKLDYDLIALNGVPAGVPAYPAPQANDIVVAALQIPASTVTILSTMFDHAPLSLSISGRHPYRLVKTTYAVALTDDLVEGDATAASFTSTLPPLASCPGQEFVFSKVDATGNIHTVAGNGGETISGQSSWDITDQWATLRVRATPTDWRILA